jgi:hypothetical protein
MPPLHASTGDKGLLICTCELCRQPNHELPRMLKCWELELSEHRLRITDEPSVWGNKASFEAIR